MLSNGKDTIVAEILTTKYRFLNYIPNYSTL